MNGIAPGLFQAEISAQTVVRIAAGGPNRNPTVEGVPIFFILARRSGSMVDIAGTMLFPASAAEASLKYCILLNNMIVSLRFLSHL